MTDPDIDGLTEKIIGCAIEVHRRLGPGLLASVYRECLAIELTLVSPVAASAVNSEDQIQKDLLVS